MLKFIKETENSDDKNLQNEKTGIINILLESEFERRLQKEVRKIRRTAESISKKRRYFKCSCFKVKNDF